MAVAQEVQRIIHIGRLVDVFPGYYSLHVNVPLGKSLNPKFPQCIHVSVSATDRQNAWG